MRETTSREEGRGVPHAAALGLLASAGGLSRLPFLGETPINWDAVQFVLALDHFSLAQHQPHPPGYISYVFWGRVLEEAVGNAPLALSILSVLLSALAVPGIYWLAWGIVQSRAVAWGAAILLLASPLALYYGSVGLTYAPEMTWGLLVGSLAWRTRTNASLQRLPAAIMLGTSLGLATSVRQTTLILLLPLCLWATWGRWREMSLFVASLVTFCFIWFVPLVAISGGLDVYLRENALLAEAVSRRTSLFSAGLDGLLYNSTFIVLALAVGSGLGVVPLGLWAGRVLRFNLSPTLRAFVLWWVVPPILFFAVTHVGQYGYVLVILPPIVLLAAIAAGVAGERLSPVLRRSGSLLGLGITSLIALTSLLYFLFALGPTTAHAIRSNHARWTATEATLARFDPGSTALVMQVDWDGPFRHAGYLLPEFRSYAIGTAQPGTEGRKGWLYSAYRGDSTYVLPHPWPSTVLGLQPGTRNVMALDEETADMIGPEYSLMPVSLADGSTLYLLASPERDIRELRIEENRIKVVYGEP
jgi:hypothetical protein